MPFFPRFAYPHTGRPTFPRDIFDLMDDAARSFEAAPSTNRRAFSPNFDVHETEKEFILEGELPGLENKDSLNIEFTDDNTLLVRGSIERTYSRKSDDEGRIHTIEQGQETVEEAPKEKEKEQEQTAVEKRPEGQVSKKGAELPRFWVSERSVGSFERSFSFPGTVDVENVKASLEHGILKVTVPKKEKPAGRKINVH